MAVQSQRSIIIEWSGDVEYAQEFSAAQVSTGSGQNQLINLSSGNNSITVPSGAIAATIIPPANNAVAITLKGVNADTGILLNLTGPTSIGLNGSVTSFVLNAAGAITGVRIIYS